jgi:hypothetical protein
VATDGDRGSAYIESAVQEGGVRGPGIGGTTRQEEYT